MQEKKKSIKKSQKYLKRRDEVDEDGNICQDDKATDGTTNDESENSDSNSSSGNVGNNSSSDCEEHAKTEKNSTRRRRVRQLSISKSSLGKMAKHLHDRHSKAR